MRESTKRSIATPGEKLPGTANTKLEVRTSGKSRALPYYCPRRLGHLLPEWLRELQERKKSTGHEH